MSAHPDNFHQDPNHKASTADNFNEDITFQFQCSTNHHIHHTSKEIDTVDQNSEDGDLAIDDTLDDSITETGNQLSTQCFGRLSASNFFSKDSSDSLSSNSDSLLDLREDSYFANPHLNSSDSIKDFPSEMEYDNEEHGNETLPDYLCSTIDDMPPLIENLDFSNAK